MTHLSVARLYLVVGEVGAAEDDQGCPLRVFFGCYDRPVGGDVSICFLHFYLVGFGVLSRANMAVTVSFGLLIGYTGKAGVTECYTDVGMTDFDE